MKVIFVPDYRNKNLYQTNLATSLSKQGVFVYFGASILGSVIRYWPDILHIHWPNQYMIANSKFMTIVKSTRFICGLILLRLFGIKIVWTVHNIADHEGKFKSIELLFSKLFVRLCNKLIVHCSLAKAEVMKVYNKNSSSIVIIPHGNYIGYYDNVITVSHARNKLNISENDKVFLYFGQIRPYKGIPELINIFKMLNNRQTKLLIVGKPLNEEIADGVSNSCKENENIKNTLEFIPDKDIQIYMNASDIVVFPFKDILTSGSVILSMSFGKPIIAPTMSCIAETLDNKGSFLFSKTENGLIDAMKSAIDTDRKTLQNMGEHNLRLAEKLGWDNIAKKTYDTYCECNK